VLSAVCKRRLGQQLLGLLLPVILPNAIGATFEKMNHGRFGGHKCCKADGPGEQTMTPSGVLGDGAILCESLA
jgi:hypothetical protein